MKKNILIILLLLPLLSFGQEITFEIEKLSKPERLLPLQSYDDIYKDMILMDVHVSKWDIEKKGIDFKYHLIAKSKAPDSLVNYGSHSFFLRDVPSLC